MSMNKSGMNPYLPLWEYIPDGEPHVFDNRLYVYGSHDRSHGKTFCMDDYVCWSAPLSDLSDFRCEGVIWKKTDDPDNKNPVGYLYAPDVAKGVDGRYYLYYFCAAGKDRPLYIGVAVCDSPAGEYKYYGKVDLPYKDYLCFDPAIFVDDDSRVWLYYGSAFQSSKDMFRIKGGAVVELDKDMVTVIGEPKLTAPNMTHALGTSFYNHPFFEASSMRKIGNRYYFIYSSMLSHELCYAVSDRPDGPFVFGGTLISNGDIGFQGNKKAFNQSGNNHGSICKINNQWYVFYHRHTQGTAFSRQGCVEKISILPDGSIPQVEMTSCGFNEGLPANNEYYSAGYCCNLISHKKGSVILDEEYEEGRRKMVACGLKNGDGIGYKYFQFKGATSGYLEWRVSYKDIEGFKAMLPGKLKANGTIELRTDLSKPPIYRMQINNSSGDWEKQYFKFHINGDLPLYISYRGSGTIDVKGICFSA